MNYIACHAARGRRGLNRKPNAFEIDGDHAICWLKTRDGSIPCLIDVNDIASLSPYTWGIGSARGGRNTRYAYHQTNRDGVRTITSMQRFLLGLERGNESQVDHLNRNGLDNRRANLRIVSGSLNAYNRVVPSKLGVRGVSFYRRTPGDRKPYHAHVGHLGRKITIGYYRTAEEAYAASTEYRLKHGLIPG
jgi:hypothetical protein